MNYPENCIKMDINYEKCQQCNSLYYLVNERCHPYPSHCTKVDNITGRCTDCEQLFK